MLVIPRGRPPKQERLVPLIVMVPADVKERMKKAGQAQHKSMSQYVREILERW